jgi:hypothetical protein
MLIASDDDGAAHGGNAALLYDNSLRMDLTYLLIGVAIPLVFHYLIKHGGV